MIVASANISEGKESSLISLYVDKQVGALLSALILKFWRCPQSSMKQSRRGAAVPEARVNE